MIFVHYLTIINKIKLRDKKNSCFEFLKPDKKDK